MGLESLAQPSSREHQFMILVYQGIQEAKDTMMIVFVFMENF